MMCIYRKTKVPALGMALGVLLATCVHADVRTTPVEVKNSPSVQIDKNANSVNASQSGEWSVGIANTPSVNVTNSPTVKIDAATNTVKASQSGTWAVNIGNTPSVNVANTPSVSVADLPMVRIDQAANTVNTLTRGLALQLFPVNQVIPGGSYATSQTFDCSGYRELRLVIGTNYPSANVRLTVAFQSPLAGYWSDVCTQPLTSTNTILAVPAYSPSFKVRITNDMVGIAATIWSQSWVYMVN